MDTLEMFQKAILLEPDADSPRLVYADWRDDDYAFFIRVQCALASLPPASGEDYGSGPMDPDEMTPQGLREAELKLFQKGRIDWWQLVPWAPKDWTLTCHAHMVSFRVGIGERWAGNDVWVYPRRGFAEVIECSYETFEAHGDAIAATTPLKEVGLLDFAERDLSDFTRRFPKVTFRALTGRGIWRGRYWEGGPQVPPLRLDLDATLQASPPITLASLAEFIGSLHNLGPAARNGFSLHRRPPPEAQRSVASFSIDDRQYWVDGADNMAREIHRQRIVAARMVLRDMDEAFLIGNPAESRVNAVEVPGSPGFIREGVHRDEAARRHVITFAADFWYSSHPEKRASGRRLMFGPDLGLPPTGHPRPVTSSPVAPTPLAPESPSPPAQ